MTFTRISGALIAMTALICTHPAAVVAQPMIEGGFLNGRSAEKGKAVGEEKKEEGKAAVREGDALERAFSKETASKGEPPKFSREGLGEKKTQGWLRRRGEKDVKVGSPTTKTVKARASWKNDMAREFGAENKAVRAAAEQTAKHAEGQAAAALEKGQKAWLDMNNNYICDKCKTVLSRMLPENSELTVRYINEAGKLVEETFYGPLR